MNRAKLVKLDDLDWEGKRDKKKDEDVPEFVELKKVKLKTFATQFAYYFKHYPLIIKNITSKLCSRKMNKGVEYICLNKEAKLTEYQCLPNTTSTYKTSSYYFGTEVH